MQGQDSPRLESHFHPTPVFGFVDGARTGQTRDTLVSFAVEACDTELTARLACPDLVLPRRSWLPGDQDG